MPLNNVRINALIRSAKDSGEETTEADGTVPGLTFKVRGNGKASWLLRYSIGGNKKSVTIGQYPAWGISEARTYAKELRRKSDTGIDVGLDKRQKKQEAAEAWTVDKLAAYYFDLASRDLASHTYKQRLRLYAKYIGPTYGSRPIPSIKPIDIGDSLRESHPFGKTIPRNLLILWTQFFHHAVGQGMVAANPCRDIRPETITGKIAPPKQRIVLHQDELRAFLRAIKAIPRPYELAIRLLLLTGVRISQLSEAKIEEFDLSEGLWRIPPERRKNRRFTHGPHEVSLPAEAAQWVSELIRLADESEYLFPQEGRRHVQGRTPRSKGVTIAGWMHRIREEPPHLWRRVTPHDLRANCKSLLAELRVDYEVRQRYLDHAKEAAMDRVYDKSELTEFKAEAARRLLAYLNRLESESPPQKVVPIR